MNNLFLFKALILSAIYNKISSYFALVKFSHTVFALPFALIGFFLAINTTESTFSATLLGQVVLCMVFARSAAMAFNRYIDRSIDKANPRTATREIPAGIISRKAALIFIIISSLLFIATTWFMNSLVFYLSPIALFVVFLYSYTKRFTSLCHFVLGLGLSLSPIGAYLAVTGEFAILPLLYSFVVLFWTAGFDILYALQDEDFDRGLNLKSIPVLLGRKNALNLSSIVHIIVGVIVLFTCFAFNFGIYYYIGSAIFIGMLTYQHIIVSPNDISKVNLAFGTTNGIASIMFAVFTIVDLFM